MCSSEYCRPYFGKECAELLSFSIRGLQGRAGLAASRPVAPKTQQMRQRRPRARSRGPGTPSGSHLSLQPQDPVGPHQRDEELDELWGERHGQPGPEETHRGPLACGTPC